MIDLSRELRDAVDRDVIPVTAAEARARAAHGHRRRRRVATIALPAALVLVIALIVGVTVPHRGGGDPAPGGTADPPTFHSKADDFSIRIPPGWYHSEEPLAPWLSDPHEILSVATAPISPINAPGNQAACPSEIPKAGVDAIGTRGIYVWLGTASRAFAANPIPRPTSFAQAQWNDLCPLGERAVTQGVVYADAGREIVVSVVIGANATTQQRTELYSMLDSLRIDRPHNPPGLSPQECIAGNKNIDTIPGLAAGSINRTRTFGVVPGRRGTLTFGKPTPVGDYLKIVWVLRNPPATDHIEIIGNSLTTGNRVQWATVLADNRVVPEPRLVQPAQGLDSPTAKDPWVSFPAAVLFPSDGCYEFTAQLADGTEIGRLRTYYSRTRSG